MTSSSRGAGSICSGGSRPGTSSSSLLPVSAFPAQRNNNEDSEVRANNPLGGPLIPNINPMENDVILQVFFTVCPKEELKSYRLVCKKWRDLSLTRWRQSGHLRLVEHFDQKQYGRGVTFYELLQEIQQPSSDLVSKPFQNYSLNDTLALTPSREWFWPTFGPSIKSLNIDLINLMDATKFLQCHAWEVPNLGKLCVKFPIVNVVFSVLLSVGGGPGYTGMVCNTTNPHAQEPHEKLKEVEMIFSGTSGNLLEEEWPWEDFFTKFCKIQKLKLSNVGTDGMLRTVFTSLTTVRAENVEGISRDEILPLKELNLMELCPEAIPCFHWYRQLIDCNFPLERLDLCIGLFGNHGIPELKRLLEGYSNTLKHLHLFRPPFYFPFQTFPIGVPMPHLETLRMRGHIANMFEFLQFMPNLTSLSVISDVTIYEEHRQYLETVDQIVEASSRAVLDRTAKTFPATFLYEDRNLINNLKMEHLTSLETDYLLSSADFRILTEWLPKVEKLSARLTNSKFLIVCERWQNLKELSVLWNSTVNDDTLTGINWTDVLRCGELQIAIQTGEMFDANGEPLEFKNRPPNITWLRKLTHLRVEPCLRRNRMMSDHGVLFGLLQSPSLKKVHVLAKLVTSETLQVLNMKIPNSSIAGLNNKRMKPWGGAKVKLEMEDSENHGRRVRIIMRK